MMDYTASVTCRADLKGLRELSQRANVTTKSAWGLLGNDWVLEVHISNNRTSFPCFFFMFSSFSRKTFFIWFDITAIVSCKHLLDRFLHLPQTQSTTISFSFTKGQSKFIIMSSGYVFVLFLAGVSLFTVVIVGCKCYPLLCVNNIHINISTCRHQGHVMFSYTNQNIQRKFVFTTSQEIHIMFKVAAGLSKTNTGF